MMTELKVAQQRMINRWCASEEEQYANYSRQICAFHG